MMQRLTVGVAQAGRQRLHRQRVQVLVTRGSYVAGRAFCLEGLTWLVDSGDQSFFREGVYPDKMLFL